MKKLFITIFVFIIHYSLFINHCNSQFYPGGHDSLLFDGVNGNSFPIENPCKCTMKVLGRSGIVFATVCVKKTIDNECMHDTFYVREKILVTSKITEVFDGDTISTMNLPGEMVELQLFDGKRLRLSQGTSIMVNENHCTDPMSVRVHFGLLYLDLTTGDKNRLLETSTDRGRIINRGTRYSVETVKDGDNIVDIVRVYEGSVTFQRNFSGKDENELKNKGENIIKLYEDYKNGKITLEEYTKRSVQLTQEATDKQPKMVTVEAGYESRIINSDNPTEPVPFDTKDEPKFKE